MRCLLDLLTEKWQPGVGWVGKEGLVRRLFTFLGWGCGGGDLDGPRGPE